MSIEAEFYLKITLTFLLSGLIFFVMMKRQKQNEEKAELRYRLFLKSKGINPDLEDK